MIDPLGQPTVTAGSNHHFSKSLKTKQISNENNDLFVETVCLAE